MNGEQVDSYQLIVQASIHGSPSLSSTAKVMIHIQDSNDNAPEFATNTTQDLKSYVVPMAPGLFHSSKLIGHIIANDADADLINNANISYQLSNHQDRFRIDNETGDILSLAEINYEPGSEYNLLVVAADKGTPSLSAVTVVHIRVADPACIDTDPERFEWNVSVSEDVGVPFVVFNLTQSTQLVDEDSEVSLSIMQPTDPAASTVFQLDDEGSVVWLRKPLDRERTAGYVLMLRVERPQNGTNLLHCSPSKCNQLLSFLTMTLS